MNPETRHIGIDPATRGLLSFAEARLVLAPGDLRMIESSEDLVRQELPPNGVGWIEAADRWWPVYALSFDLAPLLKDAPETLRLCAVLGCGSGLYGLLCDDIQIVKGAGPKSYPLPASMRPGGSPIRELAADEHGLLCLTDAEALARRIGVVSHLERQQAA